MRVFLRRLSFCVPLALMVLLAATSGMAQQSHRDRLEARKLSRQGKQLVKQGKFEQAAEKFKKADELIPAPSYKVDYATMLIELKDFLGARDVLTEAAEAKPRQWVEQKASKKAEQMLVEVDQRTPKLRISVFEPAAGVVSITVDGEPFDPTEGAVGLNPGDYPVVAEADGYQRWEQTVTLEEAQTEEIEITMVEAAPTEGQHEGEEEGGEGIPAYWAYGSWGVGVVALGLGIGFGVAAIKSTNAVLQEYDCPDLECPEDAEDDLNKAKLNGNVSTAGFVIGGVGIAAGTVLFFFSDAYLDGDDDEEEAGEDEGGLLQIEARPVLGPGYLGVSGTF